MTEEQNRSIFEALSPKQTFFAGLIGGFLVVCTIGFFILLSMFLEAGGFPAASGTERAEAPSRNTAPAQPTAPSAPSAGNVAVTPVDNDVDHILGDVDAPVTIVEYSDIECPFCTRFHNTMHDVVEKYDGQVRWVFRHFPLHSIHPNAQLAAEASECAGDQGKFWEFTDLAFENQAGGINEGTLQGFAREVGLDMNTYNNCVEAGTHTDKVNADTRNAQETGGRGTPHSIIIGPEGETVVLNGAQPMAAVEQAITRFLP